MLCPPAFNERAPPSLRRSYLAIHTMLKNQPLPLRPSYICGDLVYRETALAKRTEKSDYIPIRKMSAGTIWGNTISKKRRGGSSCCFCTLPLPQPGSSNDDYKRRQRDDGVVC